MSVVSVDIDQMHKYLEGHVDDWQCRLELADAYEEEGDKLRSTYYRWSGENQKCPRISPFLERWVWWWWENSVIEDSQHQIGDYDFWIDAVSFIQSYKRKITADYDYSNTDLQEFEYHTALFLRHKGVI